MLTTFLAAAIAVVTSFLFPVTVVLADAAQSDVIPQGLGEGLPQADAHVLHRVVTVHIEVAGGLDGEADLGVKTEGGEHVVKKADAGLDVHVAAVQVHGDLNLGLFGVSHDGSNPCHGHPSRLLKSYFDGVGVSGQMLRLRKHLDIFVDAAQGVLVELHDAGHLQKAVHGQGREEPRGA